MRALLALDSIILLSYNCIVIFIVKEDIGLELCIIGAVERDDINRGLFKGISITSLFRVLKLKYLKESTMNNWENKKCHE